MLALGNLWGNSCPRYEKNKERERMVMLFKLFPITKPQEDNSKIICLINRIFASYKIKNRQCIKRIIHCSAVHCWPKFFTFPDVEFLSLTKVVCTSLSFDLGFCHAWFFLVNRNLVEMMCKGLEWACIKIAVSCPSIIIMGRTWRAHMLVPRGWVLRREAS